MRWSRSIKNPTRARGKFQLYEFIKTQWTSLTIGPFQVGSTLKGDWRGWKVGGSCLESRACLTIDFDQNRVDVVVQPTCEKLTETTYKCHDALDINAPWPFVSAVHLSESPWGPIHLGWSLNQSSAFGAVPIDGWLNLNPPGSRTPINRYRGLERVRSGWQVKVDGFPSIELYYRGSTSVKTLLRFDEGRPTDLLSGLGDWTSPWHGWPG